MYTRFINLYLKGIYLLCEVWLIEKYGPSCKRKLEMMGNMGQTVINFFPLMYENTQYFYFTYRVNHFL